MNFTLVCDIMMDLEGSIRPSMYLAKELNARGHDVSMMSPIMSKRVEDHLSTIGITPVNLHASLAAKSSGLSMLWLETWAREAFLQLNSRHAINESSAVINFSQVISAPSLVWYLQGPPSLALKDMEEELSPSLRTMYALLRPVINYADVKLVSRMDRRSTLVIANSKFCASMYSSFGVKTDYVIYPPIDCQTFRPSTSKPLSDYVLTYLGKETKFSILKNVADLGLKIKAFGSETPFIPKGLLKHPNVQFLGRVSTKELVDLYSNAIFTMFPFTHEPFGYVPLESMACGTPVLTYDFQGPSEYVVNAHTGWLVRTDRELLQKSIELWKEEYPSQTRTNCVKAALKFDRRTYVEQWLETLGKLGEDQTVFPRCKNHNNVTLKAFTQTEELRVPS
ncbi:MAG TPA: glycosyltransferase [Candidatus Acidoferrales bacterium]|nr:glycosyltransferase [Candidatus Acidoferrales bacterium]